MFDSTPHGRVLEGQHLARTGQEVKQKDGEPWYHWRDRENAAANYPKRNS